MIDQPPIQQQPLMNNIFTRYWILWFQSIVTDLADGTRMKVQNSTGAITIDDSSEVVIMDVSVLSTVTLPNVANNAGSKFSVINKYTSTANVEFSENINGNGSYALASGDSVSIISDGSEYLICL